MITISSSSAKHLNLPIDLSNISPADYDIDYDGKYCYITFFNTGPRGSNPIDLKVKYPFITDVFLLGGGGAGGQGTIMAAGGGGAGQGTIQRNLKIYATRSNGHFIKIKVGNGGSFRTGGNIIPNNWDGERSEFQFTATNNTFAEGGGGGGGDINFSASPDPDELSYPYILDGRGGYGTIDPDTGHKFIGGKGGGAIYANFSIDFIPKIYPDIFEFPFNPFITDSENSVTTYLLKKGELYKAPLLNGLRIGNLVKPFRGYVPINSLIVGFGNVNYGSGVAYRNRYSIAELASGSRDRITFSVSGGGGGGQFYDGGNGGIINSSGPQIIPANGFPYYLPEVTSLGLYWDGPPRVITNNDYSKLITSLPIGGSGGMYGNFGTLFTGNVTFPLEGTPFITEEQESEGNAPTINGGYYVQRRNESFISETRRVNAKNGVGFGDGGGGGCFQCQSEDGGNGASGLVAFRFELPQSNKF
jgi:hypothetical protein